jgi:hypothetical protein
VMASLAVIGVVVLTSGVAVGSAATGVAVGAAAGALAGWVALQAARISAIRIQRGNQRRVSKFIEQHSFTA